MNRKKWYGIAAALFFVASFVLLSGCTSNSENVTSGPAWLKNYKPVHSVGTGADNFWTVYPEMNPESGTVVSHLDWVLDSLDKSCVLFVVHATGCVGCQAQADRVIMFGEKYEGQLVFWDLDFARGGDVEQKSYEAYVYDPDGYPGYIALTGIITLVKDQGKVTYGWHSWEGNVGDSDMETWIQDAIYYYQINS